MLALMFLIQDLMLKKEYQESNNVMQQAKPIEYNEASDIGAAVGFKDIKTGDTLCDEKKPYCS